MHRAQIYFLLFLLTAILTPTIFYWENDCQFIGMSERLASQPYALHWVPEVLCLLFGGMLITAGALSVGDAFPNVKTTIKYLLLLTTVSYGLIVLSVDILLFRDVKPVYFMGFLWGVPVLSGYMLEILIQKRKLYEGKKGSQKMKAKPINFKPSLFTFFLCAVFGYFLNSTFSMSNPFEKIGLVSMFLLLIVLTCLQ